MAQGADLLLGLGRQIDQLLLEQAEHAVQGAVDLLDAAVIQGFSDDAGHTGVDDGGGTAGLAHQDVAYEFSHES